MMNRLSSLKKTFLRLRVSLAAGVSSVRLLAISAVITGVVLPLAQTQARGLLQALSAKSRPQRESEIRKRLLQKRKGKDKQTTTSDKSSPEQGKTPSPVKPQRNAKRQQLAPQTFDVTFITNAPNVEITIKEGTRNKSLGKTGADRKFQTELMARTHNITLSHTGYPPSPQQIKVRGSNSEFRFDYPKVVPTPTPTPMPTPMPTPPPVTQAVIDNYFAPKQTDSVVAGDWQKVVERTSFDLKRQPNNAQLKAHNSFAVGQLAYLSSDYGNAEANFKEAKSSASAPLESALAAYGLGNVYFVTDKLSMASNEYNEAIKLKPDFAIAYKGLGDVKLRLERNDDAKNAYENARNYGYAYRELDIRIKLLEARSLMRGKKWEEALTKLNEIWASAATGINDSSKTKKPFLADVLTDAGSCYEAQKETLSAYDHFTNAINYDDNAAAAWYKLGKVLFGQRLYARAKQAGDKAYQLFQDRGDQERMQQAIKLSQDADKKLPKVK
jgi:tetratricopeptide (TPR) repeat protein